MHNKICFFQRAAQLQTARCASSRHVRTAHKLAADSTGASHRLALEYLYIESSDIEGPRIVKQNGVQILSIQKI